MSDFVEVNPHALRESAEGIRETGKGFEHLFKRVESTCERWVSSSDPARMSFGNSIAPSVQQVQDALTGLKEFCEGMADAVVVAADNYARAQEGNAQGVAGVAAEEAGVQPGEAPGEEGVHLRSADRDGSGEREVPAEGDRQEQHLGGERGIVGGRQEQHLGGERGVVAGAESTGPVIRRAESATVLAARGFTAPGAGPAEAHAWARTASDAEFAALHAQAEAEKASPDEGRPITVYAAIEANVREIRPFQHDTPQERAEFAQQQADRDEQQAREFEARRPYELAQIAAERNQAAEEAVAARSAAEVWSARAQATGVVADQVQDRAEAEQPQAGAGQAHVWAQRAQDIDLLAQEAQERAEVKDEWAVQKAETAQLRLRNLEWMGQAVEDMAKASRAAAEDAEQAQHPS